MTSFNEIITVEEFQPLRGTLREVKAPFEFTRVAETGIPPDMHMKIH